MNKLELDSQIHPLLIAGQNKEAFLKFYDENVVAQENDEPERKGREQWMQAREAMAANITKLDSRMIANAANGDVSFSEWSIDAEIKGMGAMKMNQVSVRRWKNGRVVRERFYHK